MTRSTLRWFVTAVLAGVVLAGFSSAAGASPGVGRAVACTKSWSNAVNGNWPDGTKWSPSGAPTSSDNVCITVNGTYTVTGAGAMAAATLTLGGTSGTQTLQLQADCTNGNAVLTVGGSVSVGSHGVLTLTSSGCSFAAQLDAGTNTITNSGTLHTVAGVGGYRSVSGNLTNSGTLTVDQAVDFIGGLANTGTVNANQSLSWFGSGVSWSNQGPLNIANGAVVATASSGQTFTNASGGSIVETGSGKLQITGGTFNHGAGTVSGANPIELNSSNLNITSANSAGFLWQGSASLSGNLAATQPLTLQASCTFGNAVATAAASFTNAGTLTLTSSGCSFAAQLDAGTNTITNSGTLKTTFGVGGPQFVNGNLANQKTVDLGAGTNLQLTGTYTQTSTGVFLTHIDSLSSFGQLTATGAASLAGKVSVSRLNAFVPNAGDSFAVLSAASRSGTWSKETGGVIQGAKYFLPTYSSTGASLLVKVASFSISPTSGPPGTAVTLTGSNYPRSSKVKLTFKDSAGTTTTFPSVTTDSTGAFSTVRNVPAGAAPGNGTFTAKSNLTLVKVSKTFNVT